jgi:hypothetical protein
MDTMEKMLKVVAESIIEMTDKAVIHPSDDSVVFAAYIFSQVMIAKMFDAQLYEKMPLEMRKKEAEQAGERVAKMVEYFTRVDRNKLKDKYAV